MARYADFSLQAGYHAAAEDAGDRSGQHQPRFYPPPTVSAMAESHNASYYNAPGQPAMVCDIKPRLTKGQHEMLESEYLKQNKPSTSTKKGFAEVLGVSLDKVNNWFQNRRAKSKQDAKKAAGAYNLFHAQHPQHGFSSDSDTSPAFAATDYFSMMQQCSSDEHIPNGLGMSEAQPFSGQSDFHHLPMGLPNRAHLPAHVMNAPPELFDSPLEINRRTLTQEQFDAFAQNAGAMNMSGNFQDFDHDYCGDQDVIHQGFPDLQTVDLKQQNVYSFATHVPHAVSSHDSTVPSTISEQSMTSFPSNSSIREPSSISSAGSGWANSHSSSVSTTYQDDPFAQLHHEGPVAASMSQWQPGQSVPVDVNALNREFQHAEQAAQARQSPQQYQLAEQPLAWPVDDAYERRDSQTSTMLAQSMSTVGLQTPQAQQPPSFTSPIPSASIAARRQRPRPAALGLAAMRSHSYSGAVQPGSPGPVPQHTLTPGQPQLRRIRSSNLVGGVAPGRVQKPMPSAPQRSPLAWFFSDAMNSPKAARHASSQPNGTRPPPTPLSPDDFSRQEQNRSQPDWQASAHDSRQPSISECDLEQSLPYVQYVPAPSAPPQQFSSPPHTPLYHQQPVVSNHVGNNVITENTPPQSAPASQSCFPSATVTTSQPYVHAPVAQSQAVMQQMHAFVQPPLPQYPSAMIPESGFVASIARQQQQFVMPPANVPGGLPMHYSHGVPVVNALGQLELMIPPQFTHVQNPAPVPPQHRPHHIPTPPKGGQFEDMVGMFPTTGPAPSVTATTHVPKPPQAPAELFVHEYSPPADLRRAASPRKTVDSGPKNYSFTNHGPEDFEKKKGKHAIAAESSSPASSAGAGSS